MALHIVSDCLWKTNQHEQTKLLSSFWASVLVYKKKTTCKNLKLLVSFFNQSSIFVGWRKQPQAENTLANVLSCKEVNGYLWIFLENGLNKCINNTGYYGLNHSYIKIDMKTIFLPVVSSLENTLLIRDDEELFSPLLINRKWLRAPEYKLTSTFHPAKFFTKTYCCECHPVFIVA